MLEFKTTNMVTLTLHEQLVFDRRGRLAAVQLPVRDYRRLLALVEDAADLRLAKARLKEPRIPLTQVTADLKRDGRL